jgi:hypothetical protein
VGSLLLGSKSPPPLRGKRADDSNKTKGDGRGDLINVQWKPIRNCHNGLPLYKEYILIKMKKIKKPNI